MRFFLDYFHLLLVLHSLSFDVLHLRVDRIPKADVVVVERVSVRVVVFVSLSKGVGHSYLTFDWFLNKLRSWLALLFESFIDNEIFGRLWFNLFAFVTLPELMIIERGVSLQSKNAALIFYFLFVIEIFSCDFLACLAAAAECELKRAFLTGLRVFDELIGLRGALFDLFFSRYTRLMKALTLAS